MVSSLIIILLVLVAVSIFWVVIKNTVSKQTGEISLDNFKMDLVIERVLLYEESITVGVERGFGGGNLIGINFVIFDGNNSETFEQTTNLGELGLETFILTPEDLEIGNIISVEIFPVFETSSEDGKIGNKLDSFDTTNLEIQASEEVMLRGGGDEDPAECTSDENVCSGFTCGEAENGTCGTVSCGTCNDLQACGDNICNLITTNLIAWWKFDGDATEEIGELDGTINDATLIQDGRFNQAYEFNGANQYISVPDNVAFDISGNVTISFWIKPESITNDQRVFHRKDWVEVKIKDGNLNEFKWKGSPGEFKPSGALPGTDVWIHVVSTIAGLDSVLYINGIEAGTASEDEFELRQIDNKPLYFGIQENLDHEFVGAMDEIMIFNRTLSAAEVAILYQTDLS